MNNYFSIQLTLAQYLFSFEAAVTFFFFLIRKLCTDTDLSKEPRTADSEYFIIVNLHSSRTWNS